MRQPKYLQIIENIIQAIQDKKLKRGDKLPSINDLKKEMGIAHDTVLRAYLELKQRGIIKSISTKGYFVATENILYNKRVFLLFDEFSPYKYILYNSLRNSIKESTIVDIYFHHYNKHIFEKLITDSTASYNEYIIMPFPDPHVRSVTELLDPNKTLILDRYIKTQKNFRYICQNFNEVVYDSLKKCYHQISAYKNFTLFFPKPSNHPPEIMVGFRRFCKDYNLSHNIIYQVEQADIQKGAVYLVIEDSDLVYVIEKCQERGLNLGKDCGILSYNDTPIKRVVANGITVISTDFAELGKMTADYINDPHFVQKFVTTQITLRKSL